MERHLADPTSSVPASERAAIAPTLPRTRAVQRVLKRPIDAAQRDLLRSGWERPRVRMKFRLHGFDRTNWDQGKSVTIAGATVTDAQVGRWHRVGLAREYEMHGVSSPTPGEWVFPGHMAAVGHPEPPRTEAREGGRTDPTRDRGRHFDNIRGSEGSNR